MVVADIDFPCGRYGFIAVADIVPPDVADMVCGLYGRTSIRWRPRFFAKHNTPTVSRSFANDGR